MRAARFHGMHEPVRVEDVEYPEPGPGEVVVAVKVCGICGSDIHFLEGMPVPGGVPMTLGHEPAGVVDKVGEDVSEWAVGDRVAMTLDAGCGECPACRADHPNACPWLKAPGLHYDGAFADFCRVPAGTLVRVPDGVSFAAAAVATDCVTTPYHALKCQARLSTGESVAVIGAGGLGNQAVVMARHLGADPVVVVDTSEAALAHAQAAGATAVHLVGEKEDPTAAIRELTGGGANVAIECVGHPETVSTAIRSLAGGGRAVLIGIGMLPPPIPIPQAIFCLSELSVIGAFASHKRDLEEVLGLQAEGKIDIESSISHRLPLEQVAEGLEMLMTKKGNPQRIVVEVAH